VNEIRLLTVSFFFFFISHEIHLFGSDEILVAARMDLWSAQAGGPRMLAGLEYRIET
jgi:hypothetical protein